MVITASMVFIVSVLLACAFFGSPFNLGFLQIVSGPLGGWVLAAYEGAIITALWSLLPLSLLTFGPLVIAVRWFSWRVACFVTAGIFWVLSGFLYGIAIWA